MQTNYLFGKSEYSQIVSEETLSLLVNKVLSEKPQAIMILCSESDFEQRDFITPFLSTLPIPVFGGIFPAIVYKGQVKDAGVVVLPINTPVEIRHYEKLENAQSNQFDFDFTLPGCNSAMVLIDGMSRNIDFVLNQLFQSLGPELKVFGGGAGSSSFKQTPCLFSNQGLLVDAMIVIYMQYPWKLAIGHGWEVLAGPFLANQTDDNKIIQLNFQPAVDVYMEVVERFDERNFSKHDFFEIAKTYPFGLERLDDDLLVRDPVTVEQSSLICVGRVLENTMLYILKGQNSNLVAAAVKAVKNVVSESFVGQGLLFDCLSRSMILKSELSSELQGISSTLNTTDLVGVIALGEIASGVSGGIYFHNRTAVTAIAGAQ